MICLTDQRLAQHCEGQRQEALCKGPQNVRGIAEPTRGGLHPRIRNAGGQPQADVHEKERHHTANHLASASALGRVGH
eukprot:CAMPEP_0115865678 /NCGR_PEP_ID=MMETSP0287-20121206/19847_1 /TAXON_ID=412157 /ORGANISM="Chrysochromulina rotalis, Strain UIO044" /LENGTH=77 /DNA_ID=CAMNT_0003320201 /DNA_START=256 /DNA_END=489 /DNA_ORIENTATION=+